MRAHDGRPLPGVTVRIHTRQVTYRLTTGSDGRYAIRLDPRTGPEATVTFTAPGYREESRTVRLVAGRTVTADVVLIRTCVTPGAAGWDERNPPRPAAPGRARRGATPLWRPQPSTPGRAEGT
ncbi:carboxypeptidase-like regulatory domain-containing protein [Streptomyces sp. NPDC048279]|uniref:carboxypeptidase-like regulatory domain-containing protein n=1 Tax=Streptomyces sp. NPDC048279 TaxID=3154714 RepID=UPI003446BE6F